MSLPSSDVAALRTTVQTDARYRTAYRTGNNVQLRDLLNAPSSTGALIFTAGRVPMDVIMDQIQFSDLTNASARTDFDTISQTDSVDFGLPVARNKLLNLFTSPSPSRNRLVGLAERRETYAELVLTYAYRVTLQDVRTILSTAPPVGSR